MTTRAPLPRPVRTALDALTGVVGDRVLLSPWTRRLARISFLGALDHAPRCRERTSRLDHSAAVAKLALRAGLSLGLPAAELRLLVTAALLHDVGHLPLSHTAESAFRARLGVDHHEITRWIIEGGGPIARERSLAPALEHAGLDPRDVWALVDGGGGPLAPLVSGTLSADTLDGIARAARAFCLRPSAIPEEPFAMRDGELFVRPAAMAALDRFWSLKDRVYRRVINAPAHAALELRIAALVGRRLVPDALDDLLAFDDRAMLAMLGLREEDLAPDEAERASSFVAAGEAQAPVRVLREYAVDRAVGAGPEGLPARDWPRRWRTSKHRWRLVTQSPSVQLLLPASWETEGDLP